MTCDQLSVNGCYRLKLRLNRALKCFPYLTALGKFWSKKTKQNPLMSKTIKSKNEEKQEQPCPWIWKAVFQPPGNKEIVRDVFSPFLLGQITVGHF